MLISRRNFLYLSGASFSATLLTQCLQTLGNRDQASALSVSRYGNLVPDPKGMLDLPPGFQYRILSRTGQPMSNGHPTPAAPDGMAAFAGDNGTTILIRNHELNPWDNPGVKGDRPYDAKAVGGTTTLVLDGERQLIRDYASLTGTVRNCAGGPTPWGSWISCEEDISTPSIGPVSKKHGYVFEVPARATEPVEAVPFKAMGRFNHEAIAVDPATSIVYLTEDRAAGLFYRFVPKTPQQLSAGGTLQALKLKDRSQAITRTGITVGATLPVEWVTIETPDPPEDTVRVEGFQKGAAQFSRGEGLWYGDGLIYFTCTNGGSAGHGQLWAYRPGATATEGGTLTLLVEPNDPTQLDFPDNLTVAPFGDLFLVEDGQGEQFLRLLTPQGELSTFARNALNSAELSGVCFGSKPLTLFVNIQQPGITFAIWGPFV